MHLEAPWRPHLPPAAGQHPPASTEFLIRTSTTSRALTATSQALGNTSSSQDSTLQTPLARSPPQLPMGRPSRAVLRVDRPTLRCPSINSHMKAQGPHSSSQHTGAARLSSWEEMGRPARRPCPGRQRSSRPPSAATSQPLRTNGSPAWADPTVSKACTMQDPCAWPHPQPPPTACPP